jgi:hypothetical protein
MRKRSRAVPRARVNLFTSLALVLPLFLFYEIGVQFTDVMNGADFVTALLLRLCGPRGFLLLQGAVLLVYLGLLLHLRRKEELRVGSIVAVLLESTLYAASMGTLILLVMVDLLHIDPRLAAGAAGRGSFFARLVMSAGAGVYEELVFRLLLLGGLAFVGERAVGLKRGVAVFGAFVTSSVLFSLAHHIGPLGEPLRLGVFVYRTLAGMVFAALYQYRSFAIAVYTHTLYDTYVLLF